MSTPNITQAEIANSEKLIAIKNYFTADALELINRSETMKNMVRAYQSSGNTTKVELWTGPNGNPGAAQGSPAGS